MRRELYIFKAVRPRRLGDVPGVCVRSELGAVSEPRASILCAAPRRAGKGGEYVSPGAGAYKKPPGNRAGRLTSF